MEWNRATPSPQAAAAWSPTASAECDELSALFAFKRLTRAQAAAAALALVPRSPEDGAAIRHFASGLRDPG